MMMKSNSKTIVAILIIAMLLLTSSCSYNTSSSKNRAKIESYSQQILQQTARNISIKAEEIEKTCMEIMFSQTIQDGIKSFSGSDEYEILMYTNEINNLLVNNFIIDQYVSSATIIINSDSNIMYGESRVVKNKDILNRVTKNTGDFAWIPISINNTNLIVVSKEIRDIASGDKLGTFFIELKESYFSSIYKSIDYGSDSSVFIIDSSGIVVSTTDSELEVAKEYKEKTLTDRIIQEKSPNEKRAFTMDISGVNEFVVYDYIKSLDWYIVGVVPTESMF